MNIEEFLYVFFYKEVWSAERILIQLDRWLSEADKEWFD